MQAKVSLALALASEPALLILDEPTSGLDAMVRREFLESMVDLAAGGRTVLLSSHQIGEVERVASHVALLHKGKLVLAEALDDLRARTFLLALNFQSRDHAEAPPAIAAAGAGRCVRRTPPGPLAGPRPRPRGVRGGAQPAGGGVGPDRDAHLWRTSTSATCAAGARAKAGVERGPRRLSQLVPRFRKENRMFARLWWKEARQTWPAWTFLAVAGIAVQSFFFGYDRAEVPPGGYAYVALVVTMIYLFLIAAAVFAGERESGTLWILDAMPVERLRIWSAKASFALATTLALGMLLWSSAWSSALFVGVADGRRHCARLGPLGARVGAALVGGSLERAPRCGAGDGLALPHAAALREPATRAWPPKRRPSCSPWRRSRRGPRHGPSAPAGRPSVSRAGLGRRPGRVSPRLRPRTRPRRTAGPAGSGPPLSPGSCGRPCARCGPSCGCSLCWPLPARSRGT